MPGGHGLPVALQSTQGSFRQLTAPLGVTVEVAPARFVQGEAGGLAAVVEEQGQAKNRISRARFQGPESVLPHVAVVVGAVLLKARNGGEFRQNGEDDGGESAQDPARGGANQNALQLGKDALGADVVKQGPLLHHGLGGGGFHEKVQPGGEPEPPQDAEPVLPKAGRRVAYGADDAVV